MIRALMMAAVLGLTVNAFAQGETTAAPATAPATAETAKPATDTAKTADTSKMDAKKKNKKHKKGAAEHM